MLKPYLPLHLNLETAVVFSAINLEREMPQISNLRTALYVLSWGLVNISHGSS